MVTRPNILLIMSDEHAPMFSGPYGHALVRTPNLDRLATEGVTFANTYCNSPLCVPSRMSFLTGRYPSRVGIYDNASPLASDIPTWAHSARGAGYDVALCGKQHFVGPDQLHGFSRQLARDRHTESPFPVPDWTVDPGPGKPYRGPDQAGPGTGDHIDIDDQVGEAALEYLRDPARADQPWLLCASFIAPHFPFVVPERFYDLYPLDDIDLPVVPDGHLDAQHPVSKELRSQLGIGQYTEDAVRRARAAYYGLITYLDEKIGQLLDALDATGQAENTLVIYTSDHGEMAGEHGMWRKSSFYEASSRVPLQLRWPGQLPAGRSVEAVVSLVDVTATLVAVAGGVSPDDLDGADLLPLADSDVPWKDEAFAEYNAHGVRRPTAMLRRGRFKLNASLGEVSELYDLESDPGEFDNLAGHPDYAVILAELTRRLKELWDPEQLEQDVLRSQRQRRIIWDSALDPTAITRAVPLERGRTARSGRGAET